MNIRVLSVGPLGTNCYLIAKNRDAIIIDPGGEPNKIIDVIKEENVTPKAILLTHAHFDHIGAVEILRNHYNIEVHLHHLEQNWLEDSNLNGSSKFIGHEITTRRAERDLTPGKLNIASFIFEVVHTPGHSPGSVSFIFHEDLVVFGGDVLFNQGIGRTDLPGGDMRQLETSIRNQFYTLDDKYIVYPGHGPKTTIRYEKMNNPFIRS